MEGRGLVMLEEGSLSGFKLLLLSLSYSWRRARERPAGRSCTCVWLCERLTGGTSFASVSVKSLVLGYQLCMCHVTMGLLIARS